MFVTLLTASTSKNPGATFAENVPIVALFGCPKHRYDVIVVDNEMQPGGADATQLKGHENCTLTAYSVVGAELGAPVVIVKLAIDPGDTVAFNGLTETRFVMTPIAHSCGSYGQSDDANI